MTADDGAAWRTWDIPAGPTTLRKFHGGRCAWCGEEDGLVQDHCHRTGLIRGLLCRGCNQQEADPHKSRWDAWRRGDNSASAIGHFEVYADRNGRTNIRAGSTLSYYSVDERFAWWEFIVADLVSGGTWPADAPWTELAIARAAKAQDVTAAAMERWAEMLTGRTA